MAMKRLTATVSSCGLQWGMEWVGDREKSWVTIGPKLFSGNTEDGKDGSLRARR